jgi:hypothetical protein
MGAETRERNAHVFQRDALDYYVEPERCTTQLLTVERFVGTILDPCCGRGHVVVALRAQGLDAAGMDIVRRRHVDGVRFLGLRDFLTAPPTRISNVVMNPPYFGGKGTEAFIRRAIECVQGKLAVFVDRRFLTGARRAAGLYSEFPPTRVWEISPRPSCPPGEWLEAGNKAGGGTADYAWLVWDRTAPSGPTQLGWLTKLP